MKEGRCRSGRDGRARGPGADRACRTAGHDEAAARHATIQDKKLAGVLTTAGKQAIYVWNKEPRGTVRCTGACAKAWPPVIVKAGVVVPMHVKGIMGEFGTVRRAGGARQLTFNSRALYTYAHENPGQVLCNNVNSWFAVKVHG